MRLIITNVSWSPNEITTGHLKYTTGWIEAIVQFLSDQVLGWQISSLQSRTETKWQEPEENGDRCQVSAISQTCLFFTSMEAANWSYYWLTGQQKFNKILGIVGN